jgi:hypothetical protein
MQHRMPAISPKQAAIRAMQMKATASGAPSEEGAALVDMNGHKGKVYLVRHKPDPAHAHKHT